jgi:hypothetical protein
LSSELHSATLRLQLLERSDAAILAQVDRIRVPHRLVAMAGLAILLLDKLAALRGIGGGRERRAGENEGDEG